MELLTSRWLGFRIVDRPAEPLTRGSRIEYRLRLFGVPLRWHTVIERYDPGRGFVARAAPAIAVQLGVIFGYRLRAVRRAFPTD